MKATLHNAAIPCGLIGLLLASSCGLRDRVMDPRAPEVYNFLARMEAAAVERTRGPAAETAPSAPPATDGTVVQPAGSRMAWRAVMPRRGFLLLEAEAAAPVEAYWHGPRGRHHLLSLGNGHGAGKVDVARFGGERGWLELEAGPGAVKWIALKLCGHVEPRDVNVLLLTIDTLRADRLSGYGYSRPTTPFLDELAQRGYRVSEAYTCSDRSAPAHASLMTGRYPQSHGLMAEEAHLTGQQVVLSEWMEKMGFSTAAFVAFDLLAQERGVSRGFRNTELVDATPGGAGPEHDQNNVYAHALNWIASRPHERQFMWIHSQYLHLQNIPDAYAKLFWNPPADPGKGRYMPLLDEAGRSQLRRDYNRGLIDLNPDELAAVGALYDGALRLTDDVLREFWQGLWKLGLDPFTAWVILSDHGVNLGEDRQISHMGKPREQLLHIPLLFVLPGFAGSVREVRTTKASILDVTPTLLSYLGRKPPLRIQGRDLLPILRGAEDPARPLFAMTEERSSERIWHAVRAGDHLYLSDGRGHSELRRVEGNVCRPVEAGADPDTAREMEALLARWLATTPVVVKDPSRKMPPEVREMLQRGGYLDDVQ